MIRSLRSRFIAGAMLALSIMLLALVGGILMVGYFQMEHRSAEFLSVILDDANTYSNQSAPPPFAFGGYTLPNQAMPAGYFVITANAQKEITQVEAMGIILTDDEMPRQYAQEILETGRCEGKMNEFKYGIRETENGGFRIVLLDNAIQIRMLWDTLRSGLFISLLALGVMFIILLPVSKALIRSYVANAEKQKQFITNAGHEIKTPIAIIQSNIDAMELIQSENKWSRNIRSQTERLNMLLMQLLSMAKLDERSVSPSKETIDFSSLLREESKSYAEILHERGLTYTLQVKSGIMVRGNREYLKQLIHILMDNAVQYTNAGGSIHLSLDKGTLKSRMKLTNTVEQLPACKPATLFDRFYRDDGSRTQKGGGCGIGLSAAQAIATMHHGRIEASYMQPNMVCFVVCL